MDTVLDEIISKQFHKWYEAFQHTFMDIGLKLGYRQDEIRDIINQFFLDLLEKKVDPSSIENPQAYLSTAFRRKLIDYHRKYDKRRLVVLQDHNNVAYIGASIQESIEQIEANTELVNNIRTAYKKLPARCRRVIDLKYYHGLSTEQIVSQTGLTKRSVYNNLFEGIKLLRKELNNASPGFNILTLLTCLTFILKSFN